MRIQASIEGLRTGREAHETLACDEHGEALAPIVASVMKGSPMGIFQGVGRKLVEELRRRER